eukprot:m.266718 g.266718  ORF g.266718 m.266718 type:complete len:61 (+) comp67722_c0_seq1:242-424(+)
MCLQYRGQQSSGPHSYPVIGQMEPYCILRHHHCNNCWELHHIKATGDRNIADELSSDMSR